MSVSHVISSASTTDDAGDRILRYTLGERINHWIAGFSYLYCLITGLAFWSPHLFWMAVIAGGGLLVALSGIAAAIGAPGLVGLAHPVLAPAKEIETRATTTDP